MAFGDRPFVPRKALPCYTLAAPTLLGVNRATLLNHNHGIKFVNSNPQHMDSPHSIGTPLIPPHLRNPRISAPHTEPSTDSLKRVTNPQALEVEASSNLLHPPYLTPTTFSDLGILSEIVLPDNQPNIRATDNGLSEVTKAKTVDAVQKDSSSLLSPLRQRAPVIRTTQSIADFKMAQDKKEIRDLDSTSASALVPNSVAMPSSSRTPGAYKVSPPTNLSPLKAPASTTRQPTLRREFIPSPSLRETPLASQTVSYGRDSSIGSSSMEAHSLGRTVKNTYSSLLSSITGAYGAPATPRTRVVVDPALEKALFFQSWPKVENRGKKPKSRTIILSELPEYPTLAMISRICENTGLVEAISLVPEQRKALVWFIESDDAKRFYDRTANGVLLSYERAEIKLRKLVLVELKKDVDILPSVVRTRVDEWGHTRVVRFVGWKIDDLKQIPGVACPGQDDPKVLLRKLAEQCIFDGKLGNIEGVNCYLNGHEYWEAHLIFAGIKEAHFALGKLRKMQALEACNITFGKDPCVPVIPMFNRG